MARETCARASLCLEDPSACEEALDAGGVILVLLMLLLPIAVACGSPCFEDRLRRLLRLMLHRFGRCNGGAENTAADDDGHGGRGPRRALAGRCLASGALVPLLTVILAVVPTVLMLLAAPAPCATGLGGCGSISCVCGSYYSQGYVFMFSTLLLLAYALLCEVARIDGDRDARDVPRRSGRSSRRPLRTGSTMRGRRLRLAMAAGSLGTLLTAVFPEHLERGGGEWRPALPLPRPPTLARPPFPQATATTPPPSPPHTHCISSGSALPASSPSLRPPSRCGQRRDGRPAAVDAPSCRLRWRREGAPSTSPPQPSLRPPSCSSEAPPTCLTIALRSPARQSATHGPPSPLSQTPLQGDCFGPVVLRATL